MARADRLERIDTRRAEVEADYRAALIAALRETAAGTWGLFDHGKDRATRAKAAPIIADFCEMADDIDAMRAQLDLEPFVLHREFMAARGPVPSSALGEPKQARAWLDRLAASTGD